MEYEILYPNDNGTLKVRMTIDDHVLEQDFPAGDSQEEFDASVKYGLAVFQSEIERNTPPEVPQEVTDLVGTPQTVDSSELPNIE